MNKKQIIKWVVVGGIVTALTIELNKHEHVHEEAHEMTQIVQTCAPFITGSYSSANTDVSKTDWYYRHSDLM